MNQLHMWQIAVDVALVATILLVSLRWVKSRGSSDLLPKTMELEASLRGLLREADSASGALTIQLRERQNHLEKLLKDLSGLEERLTSFSPTIQDQESNLQVSIEKGAAISRKLHNLIEQIRIEEDDNEDEEEIIPATPSRAPKNAAALTEKPRERSMPLPDSEIGRATLPATATKAQTRPEAPKQAKSSPAAAAYGADGKRSISDMQRIYAHAEQLLKEGRELRHVTAETALPEEEVRLLSQMIEIEQDASDGDFPETTPLKPTGKDSRLGVLGGMRRQTQTV